jgi:hypothetical protein
MAAAVAELEYRPYMVPPGSGSGTAETTLYTGIAVAEGEQWTALCRELDIAAMGNTAEAALTDLVQAVRELISYAREAGRPAGSPVPDDALREFMQGHRSPLPLVIGSFRT